MPNFVVLDSDLLGYGLERQARLVGSVGVMRKFDRDLFSWVPGNTEYLLVVGKLTMLLSDNK